MYVVGETLCSLLMGVNILSLQTTKETTWPTLLSMLYEFGFSFRTQLPILFITIVYRIMPTASDGKNSETIVATKVDVSQSAVVPNGGAVANMPLPLPVQVIERNRLTLAEILTLPRFRGYRPGEPSKVRDSLRDLSLAVGEVASRLTPRPSPPPVLIVAAFRSRHTSQ